MGKIPIVGGVQLFFFSPQKLDFDLLGLGNFVDLPLIKDTIRKVTIAGTKI